jgi:hypothetical protein
LHKKESPPGGFRALGCCTLASTWHACSQRTGTSIICRSPKRPNGVVGVFKKTPRNNGWGWPSFSKAAHLRGPQESRTTSGRTGRRLSFARGEAKRVVVMAREQPPPIFLRYAMWIGEIDRNTLIETSSSCALCVASESSGTVGESTLAMMRSQRRQAVVRYDVAGW